MVNSKRVNRRKTSRSPDMKHKYSDRTSTKSSSKSKSSKENEENTPRSTRRHSRSPPRLGKRKASPSPTSSLPGRPARKNTLNQRLQQRRVSEETLGTVPVKRSGSLERGKRANSKDPRNSKDSVTKAPPNKKAKLYQKHSERQMQSVQRNKHANVVKKSKTEEEVKIIEGNHGDSSDDTVDLNESEHVSVIKRNRSPETYQKYFKLTDWAKHAEEQNKEWEEITNNETMVVKSEIKVEPIDPSEKAEAEVNKSGSENNIHKNKVVDETKNVEMTKIVQEVKKEIVAEKDSGNSQVVTEKDNVEMTKIVQEKKTMDQRKHRNSGNSQVVTEKVNESKKILSADSESTEKLTKETESIETQRSPVKQTRKSPIRHTGNSPHRKPGSPRSSLWSANVKPGTRDWSKVKTYERKKKAEKMCSIKRSRSEDDESPKERQKRRKNEDEKPNGPPQRTETDDAKPVVNSSTSGENQNETKIAVSPTKTVVSTLTPKASSSSCMPRTSPCAVSIQRLNIQSVVNTSKNVESVTSEGNKQALISSDSQPVLRELTTISKQSQEQSDKTPVVSSKSNDSGIPITSQGKPKGSRTGSASSTSEVVMVETLHSDEEKLTSPPRVTRSRERSESRGSSVSTVSSGQMESPVKGMLN